MKHEPVKDHAERKRISALIEQCEKEQTMMKYSNSPNVYINAQALEIAIVKATTYGDALDAVREAPSIDIVRCRECKYWHKNRKDGDDIPVYDACYDFTADDFCSYGQRKESE